MKKNKKVPFWVSLVLEIIFCLCLGFALGFIFFSTQLAGNVFVSVFVSLTTVVCFCACIGFLFKKIVRSIREKK